METVCVAFKAHLGWLNAVAVRSRARRPTPLLAVRLELFDGADREALEPYHVAGGWDGLSRVAPPSDPAALIRRGRARQARAAERRLGAFAEELTAEGLAWQRAVVLTGRGRLGDLEQILSSHALIHVAEGEAVRDAVRTALTALGIDHLDQDEKEIPSAAAARLALADPDGLLRSARPDVAHAWSKEERLLALGAWLNRR
jgi:hypothetical protein